PDRAGTGPGRFPTDIDDCSALGGHNCSGLGSFSGIGELAAIREAVWRSVDDSHHLRLVEPDGSLPELQRRPPRGQRLPLPGQVIVETAFDPLHRHELSRDPPVVVDADHLEGTKPGEPSGETRDLAVMAERRIDE